MTVARWLPLAATLVATFALSSCGGGPAPEVRVLSEREYLSIVRRDCLAAKTFAEQASQSSAVPAVYLQRAAEAAELLQRKRAKVRPPLRFVGAHRRSVRLGSEQLGLIRLALARLQRGASPSSVADLQVRNRRLQQVADRIADELGVPECASDGGSR